MSHKPRIEEAKDKDLPSRPIYLRPKQVEELYGIKIGTLHNMIYRDGLPAVKVRRGQTRHFGTLIVKRETLEAWLEGRPCVVNS